ncbi:MarR family winged helix-turn-helix transcriptional regulator [Streptomyces sp. NPDC048491]|uniref:MarR family winged helix-turn-helix transcriptional regulator n=1 Tax=Streptomyces TaxID=1883 RepID=UPI000C2809E8|nr:MarR family winged helix-turn-helix transcriptional regulator [Streptomyces sp. CB01201]MBX7464614.1 MarR family winged helix-turn-helix transcriptional regulator [Streptomyces sp. MAG02]PJN04745.1 MarR family transcriptional regulator [Streptomyces sp. CB01201]
MAVDLQTLGKAVKAAQYRQHRSLDTHLASVGSTLAQWDALRAIDHAPGASARELAVATFQSEQAFGALAGRLVTQGLVDRRKGHGRRIEHHLTAEGGRVLRAGHEVADAALAECFEGLTAGDRASLLALLRKLAARPDADGG